MTPFDGYSRDMDILPGTPTLSDSDVEALLAGRVLPGYDDVHSTVRMLRTAAPPPAPAPSRALLAIIEAGFDPLPLTGPEAAALAPWRRWAARLAVATAAVVATTLGAAAANALPAPIQNAVAGALGALTPLDLPRREGHRALDESTAPLGEESRGQADPGSDPPPAGGTVPGSDPSPADVTVPRDDLPPDDLPSTVPGHVGRPPSAQPVANTPAATRDEHDDTDESDSDEAAPPDTEEPDSDEHDTDEHDGHEPDSDELQVDEPDVDEPDADGSEVDEPDADEPDVDEPSVDEPESDDGQDADD